MSSNDVYEMLTRITAVPCTTTHLLKIIDNSPLLTPEQMLAIKSVLPSYYYGMESLLRSNAYSP